MKNLLAGLTVKGLGYAVIALSIALALSIGGWTLHAKALGAKLTTANEAKGKAEGQLADCQRNNGEWQATAEAEGVKRATCVAQQKQQTIDAAAAIDLATKGKARADSDLAAFRAIWAQVSGQCTAALANMQHACEGEIGDY